MASYDDELEEGYDYSWHPSEEEFTSPITAEMWAELLGDPKFADTDAAKAVRCLKDYGEPATFQQLSIRYRSAMGRYRRWLAEAARTAGERFGVEAPTQDQFGLDEWWPVLYQTRNAGKPGAGIFEMQLRPEVIEAYEQLEEAEKMAKRKENALQLQRIEQLERARQEQRRREAERANAAEASRSIKPAVEDAAPQAKEPPKTSSKGAKKEAEQAPVVAPASPKPRQSETKADEAPHAPHTSAPATKDEEPTGQAEKEKVAEALPATSAFLKLVGSGEGVAPVVSEAMPEMPETLDYKARYARRLREALSLIMEVEPHVTAATVARLIGDESVETLQDVLNGKAIPTFDCLDRLAGTLFIGTRRLEALDGLEGALPTFVSLAEVAGVEGASRLIADAPELEEIAFVTDDSRERRCAIIVRYATLRCCLLTRVAVSSARRRKTAPELPALTAARAELEEYCGRRSIALTEHEVGASDFDALVWGQIWPGWFFA